MKRVLVVGGAGFIGSCFVDLLVNNKIEVVVFDKLTYAGSLKNLSSSQKTGLVEFVRGDIADKEHVREIVRGSKFDAIVNFAAETHVDNSIGGPAEFLSTNVGGVFNLLESVREALGAKNSLGDSFRFVQVSTDEVFGSLSNDGSFSEASRYQPNSPYSATKAAGDHLVRAWFKTYGVPSITTNCSNNFGPRQHPEKLIPKTIYRALKGEKIPIYGTGKNVRDWLFVERHCFGIFLALTQGTPGQVYCFGGDCEVNNLDIVQRVCHRLDELENSPSGSGHFDLVEFVSDRPGHDWRYAIDCSKAKSELRFDPMKSDFERYLDTTVDWYYNLYKSPEYTEESYWGGAEL